MSTSCKPATIPPIAPFPYNELPAAGPSSNLENMVLTSRNGNPSIHKSSPDATATAAVREAARREGEAGARALFDQQIAEVRESMRKALNEFARGRAAYYQQVEGEVVQLAINIARKILHRETQIDPLLMAGMVRVALERMEDATQLKVRVAPQQVPECREFFAQNMENGKAPEVVEDASLSLNHCILQTTLGTTDIGPEVQLCEIEQGLLDLLDRRPKKEA